MWGYKINMRYEIQKYCDISMTWKTGKKYETKEQAKNSLKPNQRIFDMYNKQPV